MFYDAAHTFRILKSVAQHQYSLSSMQYCMYEFTILDARIFLINFGIYAPDGRVKESFGPLALSLMIRWTGNELEEIQHFWHAQPRTDYCRWGNHLTACLLAASI